MATTIKLKSGSGAPLAGDLVAAEPAFDLTNKRLYTENASGTIIEVGTNPSTIDINAGTIDGTVIGGASAAAGTFTTFTSTGIDDNATSTAITIDSSDNVGIGTNTTAERLRIQSGDVYQISFRNNSASGIGAFGLDSSNNLVIYGNTAERMRIDSSGNVGIGTTSPTVKLQVTGSGSILRVSDDTSTSGTIELSASSSVAKIHANTYSAAVPLAFEIASSEKMRIDSSGNVGIGTDSPTNSTNYTTVNVSGDSTGGGQILFQENTSVDGFIFSTPSNFTIGAGVGNPLIFQSNSAGSSERMRIDSNGNVGIGTSSPASELDIRSGTATNPKITLNNTSGTACSIEAGSNALIFNGNVPIWKSGDTLTEYARIDASGNLLVGKTAVDFSSDGTAVRDGRLEATITSQPPLNLNRKTTVGDIAAFYYNTAQVGGISVNASSTTYNTSSDQRLKENIVDAPAGNIDAIRVRSFDWKVDGTHQTYGMVAQELVDVAPEAVTQGETEDDMWGVDYSKLVPMMIKEIQDLKAEVATLKGA